MTSKEKLAIVCDVDSIVKKLEESKVNCKNTNTIFDTNDYIRLDKAIEIIKEGGKGK